MPELHPQTSELRIPDLEPVVQSYISRFKKSLFAIYVKYEVKNRNELAAKVREGKVDAKDSDKVIELLKKINNCGRKNELPYEARHPSVPSLEELSEMFDSLGGSPYDDRGRDQQFTEEDHHWPTDREFENYIWNYRTRYVFKVSDIEWRPSEAALVILDDLGVKGREFPGSEEMIFPQTDDLCIDLFNKEWRPATFAELIEYARLNPEETRSGPIAALGSFMQGYGAFPCIWFSDDKKRLGFVTGDYCVGKNIRLLAVKFNENDRNVVKAFNRTHY